MLLQRERRQCASKALVGLQVTAGACSDDLVNARCPGKSVGGSYVERDLPARFSFSRHFEA